jgi:hypothetical protein
MKLAALSGAEDVGSGEGRTYSQKKATKLLVACSSYLEGRVLVSSRRGT